MKKLPEGYIEQLSGHFAIVENERGASTIFVVIMMAVFFVFTVLIIDVGQLIFEKIRLQTTVDLCALSAASVQAAGLNEIADLNYDAKLEYRRAKSDLGGGRWHSYGQARSAFTFHNRVLENIDTYRNRANVVFAAKAHQIAERVKRMNLPGSSLYNVAPQPSRLISRTQIVRKPVRYSYYLSYCPPDKCSPKSVKFFRTYLNPSRYWLGHSYNRYYIHRKGVSYGSRVVKERWIKATSDQTYAAYGLRQEVKPFILGDLLFDLRNLKLPDGTPQKYKNIIDKYRTRVRMPVLTAYAGAKPNGGDIYDGNAEYRPILYPLNSFHPSPRIPELSSYRH